MVLSEGVKVVFLSFKQLPLNIKQKCESLPLLIDGERLLSVFVGVDFHDTTLSVSPSYFKV